MCQKIPLITSNIQSLCFVNDLLLKCKQNFSLYFMLPKLVKQGFS